MPQALIQRLIILHDGLIPSNNSSCRDRSCRRWRGEDHPGATLSEDASLEEHAEFVLYYHNHSLPLSTPSSPSSEAIMEPIARHATEKAVRFAGLCRALHSLPRALGPHDLCDNDDDGNSEITCIHTSKDAVEYDGSFSSSDPKRGITHTMESIANYPSRSYEDSKMTARIVMNTQQISDIPMNYNNWDYDYLRPVQYNYFTKPESSIASAFISNCGAQSFRLREIDSKIAC